MDKTAHSGKTAFYITKDNPDGSCETVLRLQCGREEAIDAFLRVVGEQKKEYHEQARAWRVVRLFDEAAGEEIMKES